MINHRTVLHSYILLQLLRAYTSLRGAIPLEPELVVCVSLRCVHLWISLAVGRLIFPELMRNQ